MKCLVASAAFAAALCLAAPAEATVTLAGTRYNVSVTTGTCAGIFAGCDSANDFTFHVPTTAASASVDVFNLTGVSAFVPWRLMPGGVDGYFADATGTHSMIGNINTNFQFGTFAYVPEPATWVMMLLGFGMLGFAVRRQKVPLTA